MHRHTDKTPAQYTQPRVKQDAAPSPVAAPQSFICEALQGDKSINNCFLAEIWNVL